MSTTATLIEVVEHGVLARGIQLEDNSKMLAISSVGRNPVEHTDARLLRLRQMYVMS